MARVTNGIGMYLSGSIEGLVFVKGKHATYMRALPRLRTASEWSEKQKQARKGFGSVNSFAKEHKLEVIVPIWNKAAQNMAMSGYNLFVKNNRAAFDAQGNVNNPALLHFSKGELALPYRLWAEKDAQNPGSISVSWTDQLSGSANGDDCLMAVTYQNGDKGIVDTGFTRKEGKATLANPTSQAGDVFLFLFFWNPRLDQYSDNQVFAIK